MHYFLRQFGFLLICTSSPLFCKISEKPTCQVYPSCINIIINKVLSQLYWGRLTWILFLHSNLSLAKSLLDKLHFLISTLLLPSVCLQPTSSLWCTINLYRKNFLIPSFLVLPFMYPSDKPKNSNLSLSHSRKVQLKLSTFPTLNQSQKRTPKAH